MRDRLAWPALPPAPRPPPPLLGVDWIQGQYIQAMDTERFVFDVLMPELVEAGLEAGVPSRRER